MFWGNRGVLVDSSGQLTRYSRGRAWLICVLSYKGIRRNQWTPGRLTELYFLDEATGLAAGHRPCGECRYRDQREFKRCWARAFGVRSGTEPAAALGARPAAALGARPAAALPGVGEIDARLHADRLAGGPGVRRDPFAGASVRRTFLAAASSLPDGAMVSLDGSAWLVRNGELLEWTPGGYTGRRPLARPGGGTADIEVITPRATVAVLAAGYRPVLHPTAT
jgi:hypothetical protein